jgi:hypothetical protein
MLLPNITNNNKLLITAGLATLGCLAGATHKLFSSNNKTAKMVKSSIKQNPEIILIGSSVLSLGAACVVPEPLKTAFLTTSILQCLKGIQLQIERKKIIPANYNGNVLMKFGSSALSLGAACVVPEPLQTAFLINSVIHAKIAIALLIYSMVE